MDTVKEIIKILNETDSVVSIDHKPTKKDPTRFKYILFCEDYTSEGYIGRDSVVSIKEIISSFVNDYALGNPFPHDSFEEYMNSVGDVSRFLDAIEAAVKKAQAYNWIRTAEDFAEAKSGNVALEKRGRLNDSMCAEAMARIEGA